MTDSRDKASKAVTAALLAAILALAVSAQPQTITGKVVGVNAFSRLCVRLKIENFRFHDLRHTTASWMRMSGADIHTVAELLGHRDLAMAKRYQHLSPAFLAEAVGKLDAVLGDALGLKRGENGEERYRDVTAKFQLTDVTPTNGDNS